MRLRRSTWAGAAALGLSTGCWVTNAEGETLRRDITQLQTTAESNKKALDEQRAALGEQMERAERQIAEVQKTIDELNRAARNTDADFGVMLEEIRKELAQLRGQIELTSYKQQQLEAKLDGDGSLTARIEALEKQLAKKEQPPPPAPREEAVPKDKEGLLAYGKELAKKDVDAARGVFRDILKKWPKEASIADQARYELGELYFKEEKFRNALPEYIEIVEKFSSGDLVDDAYWRIALCSIELGNLEDGKVFLQEILTKHKSSPLTKAAKAKLTEIDKRLEKEAADKKAKGAAAPKKK